MGTRRRAIVAGIGAGLGDFDVRVVLTVSREYPLRQSYRHHIAESRARSADAPTAARPATRGGSAPSRRHGRRSALTGWSRFQKSRGVRSAWIALRSSVRALRALPPDLRRPRARSHRALPSDVVRCERARGLRGTADRLLNRPPACPASQPTLP